MFLMIVFNLTLKFLHFNWDIWGNILYFGRSKQTYLQSWTKYCRYIFEINKIGFSSVKSSRFGFSQFCGATGKVLILGGQLGTYL